MRRSGALPPLHDGTERGDFFCGCHCRLLRHWLLWRLAILLLSALLVCGAAAGIAFLLRLRVAKPGDATAGTSTGGGYRITVQLSEEQQEAEQDSSLLSSTMEEKSADNAPRAKYLASSLGVLLNGGWPTGARFHPTSFKSEIEVLNETVYCDKPLQRDTYNLVYSEPTWVCKNVRVGLRRLPFSDSTSRTLEEMMMLRQKELHGSAAWLAGDACGHLPDRRDNVLLLCEMLLAGMRPAGGGEGKDDGEGEWTGGEGDGHRRWAGTAVAVPAASSVHIPYGNCSLPEQRRIILVGMATNDAVWYTESNWKSGFVTDLYCSFTG